MLCGRKNKPQRKMLESQAVKASCLPNVHSDTSPYLWPCPLNLLPSETHRGVHVKWRVGSKSLGPVNLVLLLPAENVSMAPSAIKMEIKLLTAQVSSLHPCICSSSFSTPHFWWGPETSAHATKAMHSRCQELYVL